MCPSLIEIGSKTAEKNSAQTNKQTNRHYENNGHLAVNQKSDIVQWSLFTFHRNNASISYRFRDIASYLWKVANFPMPRVFDVTVRVTSLEYHLVSLRHLNLIGIAKNQQHETLFCHAALFML